MKTERPGLRRKRAFDVAASLLGLVFFFPVLVLCALAIFFTMGLPVFFRQIRPGRHAQPFLLLKFRTMTLEKDASGNLLPDGQRLTAVGRFLRATSLDELPQLWNVLRGDMSLVGPRPLLMAYLSRYTPFQFRRHDMPPGITGWAQVNGRNAIDWEEKFRLDVEYVDRWTLGLDFKILWMTLGKVLKRRDISQRGHATMPEFLGSPPRSEENR